MALTSRRIARVHKILGLVIGLQFLFWTASGLFFTLFSIDTIHGDAFRPHPDHGQLVASQVRIDAEEAAILVVGEPSAIELRMFLGDPVWLITTSDGKGMIDAVTGDMRSPITQAELIELTSYGSDANTRAPGKTSISYMISENPLREYGGPLPAWIVEYEPGKQRIYVDAMTGEIKSVRTTKWRIFDVLWRFHILDVTGADEFDSWWLKLAAFLGLTTVLFGFALLIDRARKGRLFS